MAKKPLYYYAANEDGALIWLADPNEEIAAVYAMVFTNLIVFAHPTRLPGVNPGRPRWSQKGS